MEITIPTPRTFKFKRTARSHGWCELPPFAIDDATCTLTRVIDMGEAPPVTVTISEARRGVRVVTALKLGKRATEQVVRVVRHMLRLDDDIGSFYKAISLEPDFGWIARAGAGRLLRSPTVFEDLIKTICTTNCSWALTDKMVRGLVSTIGRESCDGLRSFPTPDAMAAQPEQYYRDEVRAGYRAPYLKELADRVASGSLDVEAWLTSELPTAELKREMQRVKGVGLYAAENLLRLVGRYDGLALDSWVRAKFARVRNNGKTTGDEDITRYYARFGEWCGLAFWCDMTRDWLEEN